VLRVRYEEFVADPVAGTRSLCDFAGLAPPDGALGFLGPTSAVLGTGHSAAGNPMRFSTGRVELRHDDAWRDALPTSQRHLVSALTAPLLGAYGYRVRTPR
jgi:hypothetical protein